MAVSVDVVRTAVAVPPNPMGVVAQVRRDVIVHTEVECFVGRGPQISKLPGAAIVVVASNKPHGPPAALRGEEGLNCGAATGDVAKHPQRSIASSFRCARISQEGRLLRGGGKRPFVVLDHTRLIKV